RVERGPGVREAEAAVVTLDHREPKTRAANIRIGAFEQQRPLPAAAQEAVRLLPFDGGLRRDGRGRLVAAIKAHSCTTLAPTGPQPLFHRREYTGQGETGQLEGESKWQ